MRGLACILIVLVGCATTTAPAPPARRPPAPRQAPPRQVPNRDAETVAGATKFALGGTGVTGAPTREFTAILAIADRDDVTTLAWLAVHATPEGRLLAVWALETLAPDRAGGYLDALRQDSREVTTMTGCNLGKRTVADVAAEIAAGSLPALTVFLRSSAQSPPSTPAPSPR